MTVRTLALHSRYECGRSGVCCGAGWAIPVESPFYRGLRQALEAGRLRPPVTAEINDLLPASAGLPDGYVALLGRDGRGRCLFYEHAGGRGRCAVHHQLGPGALPMTCRHFPRLVVLTPDGADIGMSHYCPTSAALLFDDEATVEIVHDPPAFPAESWYEGLDTRRGPGPWLRPGVFLGWPAHRAFERHLVATLGRPDLPPADALDAVMGDAQRVARWSPELGSLEDHLPRALTTEPVPPRRDDATIWSDVTSSVILSADLREDAIAAATADVRGAVPPDVTADPALAGPIRRYLAARAFASWVALQGGGVRTAALGPRAAWVTLRVQMGRLRPSGPFDRATLEEAIRAADLVLVHLAAPEVLAARLSAVEAQPH